MTTIEKDASQPFAAVAAVLDDSTILNTGDSSHQIGSNRLSIFGGWCRLLVCLALLAVGQQCLVGYLRSPASPAIRSSFTQYPVSQHAGPQPESMAAPQFMVDVNHAPQHELEALPEVGPGLATRIVDYRQSQGPFLQIDDLLHVRGVGPQTLEQLRPMLLVRQPVE